jgi:hypothetical protein
MNDNDQPTRADALRALRERGVTSANDLVEHTDPDKIMSACRKWDREPGASPALLAWRIIHGHTADDGPKVSKGEQLRVRFDDYARRFPEGTVTETHAALWARRYPDEVCDCAGRLVVWDAHYPNIAVECDGCSFEVAYPVGSLHVLGAPGLREATADE